MLSVGGTVDDVVGTRQSGYNVTSRGSANRGHKRRQYGGAADVRIEHNR